MLEYCGTYQHRWLQLHILREDEFTREFKSIFLRTLPDSSKMKCTQSSKNKELDYAATLHVTTHALFLWSETKLTKQPRGLTIVLTVTGAMHISLKLHQLATRQGALTEGSKDLNHPVIYIPAFLRTGLCPLFFLQGCYRAQC
jgi:hypothetical protein